MMLEEIGSTDEKGNLRQPNRLEAAPSPIDFVVTPASFVSRVIEDGAKTVQTSPARRDFGKKKSLLSNYFHLSLELDSETFMQLCPGQRHHHNRSVLD